MSLFSVLIPTCNRQNDLKHCLESILRQDLYPAEIIIVDDAELGGEFIDCWKNKLASSNINLIYYRKDLVKEKRSSSISRNIGFDLAKENICFVLDDDLRLEDYFFSKIMAVWKEDNKLLGVGGVIINNRQKNFLEKVYNKLFGLDAALLWDINQRGFQSWDDKIEKIQTAFYVHGGACAYDKEAVKKIGEFTVFGGGREALEDVDFCWRAKLAGYYFLIEPQARVFHAHSASGRENEFITGYKESLNRKIIWQKFGQKGLGGLVSFYWANFGWIFRQILKGKIKKTLGLIRGL